MKYLTKLLLEKLLNVSIKKYKYITDYKLF